MSGPCDQNFMRDLFKDSDTYQIYIFCSAVKRLIAINRIQNKSFVYIIYVCVLCIFIMYI